MQNTQSNKTPEDKLKEYATEVGAEFFSLDNLIRSHRYLRSLNLEDSVARTEMFQTLRKNYQEKLDSTKTIQISELAYMSVLEIAELIKNNTDND